MKLIKCIKRRDKFGHPTQFQFNNEGSYHNTVFGGLVSITIILFMIGYVSILIKNWIGMHDDFNSTVVK